MLFRAILSLLSIPEGIAAEDRADGLKASGGSWRGGGAGGPTRSRHSRDETLGKNRWGSFRGRGLDLQTGQCAGETAGTSVAGACSSGSMRWLLLSSSLLFEVVVAAAPCSLGG